MSPELERLLAEAEADIIMGRLTDHDDVATSLGLVPSEDDPAYSDFNLPLLDQ